MNEKKKIMLYLETKGISKNSFYKKTGFSQGFLNSGNTIGADKVKIIISNYPDLSLSWLVLDIGDMLNPNWMKVVSTSGDVLALYKELVDKKDVEISKLNKEIGVLVYKNTKLLHELKELKKVSTTDASTVYQSKLK